MRRKLLVQTISMVALAAGAGEAIAGTGNVSGVTGGGAALVQHVMDSAIQTFNAGAPSATFSTYWAAGSGAAQAAFLDDDLTCDIDKVTGANGGACAGPAGGAGNTVDYAVSDLAFSDQQLSGWATSSFGQSAAGNLIQLPLVGDGVAVPVNNPAITSNGALTVSDNDLCGIFSGKVTDFRQITDSKTKPAPGAFDVVYRSDAADITFLLTSHLADVCNGDNSPVTFTATTAFASLFPDNKPPANFMGEPSDQAVADDMAGCNGPLPDAFGYLSPDYTTVDPKSGARLGCDIKGSNKSPLVVAAVSNGKTDTLPTPTEIALGLQRQMNKGYPIVGYVYVDVAQCYADPAAAAAVVSFLDDIYTNPKYLMFETNNGFATLARADHALLLSIEDNILSNKSGQNENIENQVACAGKAGR